MALWGGRFEGGAAGADPLFRRLNDSLPFDRRLVHQDIAGSIAWAGAIHRAGVLTANEHATLVAALRALDADAAARPEAIAAAGDEDVHAWVEARLGERVGPLAKKLHTGRSRNDQAATDLRLWTREELDARMAELREVQGALLRLARREQGTAFPGYTHLQPAQPVLLAHWCLAYFEMFDRDTDRIAAARRRLNVCPLGAGALAGTAYQIDRAALARELGFDGPTPNSLDTVADRDFVLDALACAVSTAVHASRLAEDLIVYSTAEFALVRLGDDVTSGSSLMPQKKNPDALELARGKCGRILAAFVALATVQKGLPLAYNKDLQEDKEPLFDAMDHLSLVLRVLPRVLDGLTVDAERARRLAGAGHSNATELADYLVSRGVAFRDAHEAVGRIVRAAIERGAAIEDLSIEELRRHAPQIGPDVYGRLTVDAALGRRDTVGGTSPRRVSEALDEAERRWHARAATAGNAPSDPARAPGAGGPEKGHA